MLLALALRELRRRAVRSTLTILGIAIGVAALVLLGALSEKMGRLVAGGRDFATGQITVSGAGTGALTGMTRGGLLSGEQLEAVRAVPGVDAVAPIVMFPLSDTPASLPFTMSPLVFGVDLGALVRNHANRHVPPPAVHAGRLVPAPGSDEVVLGSEVARLYGATVGATLTIRGRAFQVVGVLDPTLTGPDSLVFMPFETAERLLVDSEPLLRHLLLVPGARVLPIATAAAVFRTTGADPSAVAARIAATVPGLTVLSPAEAARHVHRRRRAAARDRHQARRRRHPPAGDPSAPRRGGRARPRGEPARARWRGGRRARAQFAHGPSRRHGLPHHDAARGRRHDAPGGARRARGTVAGVAGGPPAAQRRDPLVLRKDR